jgi:hypothetical protein
MSFNGSSAIFHNPIKFRCAFRQAVQPIAGRSPCSRGGFDIPGTTTARHKEFEERAIRQKGKIERHQR